MAVGEIYIRKSRLLSPVILRAISGSSSSSFSVKHIPSYPTCSGHCKTTGSGRDKSELGPHASANSMERETSALLTRMGIRTDELCKSASHTYVVRFGNPIK